MTNKIKIEGNSLMTDSFTLSIKSIDSISIKRPWWCYIVMLLSVVLIFISFKWYRDTREEVAPLFVFFSILGVGGGYYTRVITVIASGRKYKILFRSGLDDEESDAIKAMKEIQSRINSL